MSDDDLLKVPEVAAIFQVDPGTVRRWISAGKLPAMKTPGGSEWRVRREDLSNETTGGGDDGDTN